MTPAATDEQLRELLADPTLLEVVLYEALRTCNTPENLFSMLKRHHPLSDAQCAVAARACAQHVHALATRPDHPGWPRAHQIRIRLADTRRHLEELRRQREGSPRP